MFSRFTSSRREAGFTIVEILVVIVILGLLAAIIVPVYKYQRSHAQDAATTSDVRNIAMEASNLLADPKNAPATLEPATMTFKASPNVKWNIKGNATSGYCIVAYNSLGKNYTDDSSALTYDSLAGGLGKTGSACDGTLTVPETPVVANPEPTPNPSTSTPPLKYYGSGKPWWSGAGGNGVPTAQFAAFRDGSMDMITTWAHQSDAAAATFPQFASGGNLAPWGNPMDVTVGAFQNDGSSWAAAANGAYDAKWRASLTKLAELRKGKLVYIRFAHEMNGDSFPWKVTAGNKDNFINAWKRYRAIQKDVFPEAKLVFSVKQESSPSLGMDWRQLVPGYAEGNVKAYVDLMSVDYFNNNPYVDTVTEFKAQLNTVDVYGAPVGLSQHLLFAKSVGLGVGVSEWAGDSSQGNNVEFMKAMQDFFWKNFGFSPGTVMYESYYNVDTADKKYLIYGSGVKMSAAAREYTYQF